MSYFLIDEKISAGNSYEISGDEAQHIAGSRRAKKGDIISVQGINEVRCSAEITDKGSRVVAVKTLEVISAPPEPAVQIILLQALIAEQALDFILQKATELGASKIILFPSEHSPVVHSTDKKMARWQKICIEAAKQSDRLRSPKLHMLNNLPEALEYASSFEMTAVLDPLSPQSILKLQEQKPEHIGILIGPEGGWANEEIKLFKQQKNLSMINFGPRILRAETAAIASLAMIQGLFGDIG